MLWPRGKVLGGSSSINGLIYIRGQKQDFDLWRQLGNAGWSYEDVLPYFRRAENQERGADELHGAAGRSASPICRASHELHDAFIAGAQEAGHRLNPDFNGAEQEGVGPLPIDGSQHAPLQRGGRLPAARDEAAKSACRDPRIGAPRDCSRAARCRPRIFAARGGAPRQGPARDVAGRRRDQFAADAAALRGRPRGIVARARHRGRARSPGVGENLQDHVDTRIVYRARRANTLNEISRSWRLQTRAGLEYALRRRGALMMGAAPIGLFVRTRPGLDFARCAIPIPRGQL